MLKCPSLETPDYVSILSKEERIQYEGLRDSFSKISSTSISTFTSILARIKEFCLTGGENDTIKSFVCGIAWFSNAIAVEMQRLKKLTGLSKTVISLNLKHLGYSNKVPEPRAKSLMSIIFYQQKFFNKSSQSWNVYELNAMTPFTSSSICQSQSISSFDKISQEIQSPAPNYESVMHYSVSTPDCKLNDDPDSLYNDPFCLPPIFLLENAAC